MGQQRKREICRHIILSCYRLLTDSGNFMCTTHLNGAVETSTSFKYSIFAYEEISKKLHNVRKELQKFI